VAIHGKHYGATLIPTITVPVVVLGTFAVLGLAGYSINMLTMFAMVLAIGLLVDDAIVVVENVERIMQGRETSCKRGSYKVNGSDYDSAYRNRSSAFSSICTDGIF